MRCGERTTRRSTTTTHLNICSSWHPRALAVSRQRQREEPARTRECSKPIRPIRPIRAYHIPNSLSSEMRAGWRTRNRIEFERSSLGVARYDSRPRLCRSLSAHSELVNKYVTHPRVTVSLIFPQSQLNSLFDVSRHVVYQSSNTNSQRDPRRQEVRVLQVPGGADDGDPCIAVNEQLRLGGRQRQHNQTFKFEPTLTHPRGVETT